MSNMWQQHRATLARLYQVERRTLPEVKQIMEEQYAFPDTPLSTYETKLKVELKLKKKLKAQDWIAIGRYFARHRNQVFEVYLNGVLIPGPKVRKEISRNSKRRPTNHSIGSLSIPDYVFLKAIPRSSSSSLPDETPTFSNFSPVGSDFDFSHNASEFGENMDLNISSNRLSPGPYVMNDGRTNTLDIRSPENHQLVLFDKIIESAKYKDTSILAMSFDSLVLDANFQAIWSPRLDRLPFFQFQSSTTLSSVSMPYFGDLSDVNSMISPNIHHISNLQRLEHMDAFQLGLSTHLDLSESQSSQTFAFESTSSHRPHGSQLAWEIDPFHTISTVLYCLSNNSIIGNEMQLVMRWLFDRIPPALLDAFLRMDCATVRASRKKLLDWAFYLGGEDFFISFMAAVMNDSNWIRRHGAYCLVAAAWLNCAQICSELLHHGVSPDHGAIFPPTIETFDKLHHQTALGYVPHSLQSTAQSLPLVEAAAMGHDESMRVLLEGGADIDLRCQGYTAAGYVLLALRRTQSASQSYLSSLKRLLDHKLDVDAYLWDNPEYKNPEYEDLRRSPETSLDCSEETLFDEAYLRNQHEVVGLFAGYRSTLPSNLTISGIISSAEQGNTVLKSYLDKYQSPQGLRRHRLKEIALLGSFDRLNAFISMTYLGFNHQIPHLRSDSKFVWRLLGQRQDDICLADQELLVKYMSQLPVAKLPHDVIFLMLGKVGLVKTALIKSCLINGRQNFKHLLSSGLEVNGEDGIVLMAEAARWKNKEAISLLISLGVDINMTLQRKKVAWSVLLLSVTGKTIPNELGLLDRARVVDIEMLDFLYSQGANVGSCYEIFKVSVENINTINGHILRWLIKHGLDLRGKSIYDIMMRIGRASCEEKLEILRILRKRELPIFSTDLSPAEHGVFTTMDHPLSYFISLNPDPVFIRQLLQTGINVNGRGLKTLSKTPLQAAVEQGNISLVKELVVRGANVNDRCGEMTSLQLACQSLSIDRQTDQYQRGPKEPCISIIQYLLQHGAELNERVNSYAVFNYYDLDSMTTLLHIAIVWGPSRTTKLRVVKALLDHGADVNARGVSNSDSSEYNYHYIYKQTLGLSPLEQLCGQENACIELAKLLLDNGAEIHPPLYYTGLSALELSCREGNLCILKLLLMRGADPNRGHPNTQRSLAIAAGEGNIPAVLLLLDAGAKAAGNAAKYPEDVNIPLAAAAYNGKLDTVVLLLDHETRDEAFEEAIKWARAESHVEIEEIIQSHVDRITRLAVEEVEED